MNKRFCRKIQDLGGWIKYCFCSPHFLVLVSLMLLVWLLGILLDWMLSKSGSSMAISFYRLFDFGMISKAPSKGLKIVSLLEFLFTWAIGSGILLTILVDRTLNYCRLVREGLLRYKQWMCEHAIVLGWNPTALVHVREILDYNRYCNKNKVNVQKIKTILILSGSGVGHIRSQLKSIDNNALKDIEVIIYDGIPDSVDELMHLNLNGALRLYVVGESSDSNDVRDTRALLVLGRIIGSKQLKNKGTKLPCYVWISKYALYHKLIAKKVDCNEMLDVRYLNYYVNWAHKFGGFLPSFLAAQFLGNANPLLYVRERTVRLLIVGFSQMGQAIVEFILRSGYMGASMKDKGMPNLIIDIIDRRVKERKEAFETLFPALSFLSDKSEDWKFPDGSIELRFKPFDVHSPEFYSHLRAVYGQQLGGYERLGIVLGFDGVDDMTTIALSIQEIVGTNVPIFVRQNLPDGKHGMEERSSLFDIQSVFPFGSMLGAGYNCWLSEELHKVTQEHIHRDGAGEMTNESLIQLDTLSYCEVVPSIFATAGYLLCETGSSDFNNGGHETGLESSLEIREIIHKCKVMERFMAAENKRDCESIMSEWSSMAHKTFEANIYERLQRVTINSLRSIGYSFMPAQLAPLTSSDGGLEELGNKFLMWYGVSVAELSNVTDVRNPHTAQLLDYGRTIGSGFVAQCKKQGIDVEYVVGGSLAYDAVLKDRYDVDLRLLVDGDVTKDTRVKDTLDRIKEIIGSDFVRQRKGKVGLLCEPREPDGVEPVQKYIWQLQRIDNNVKGVPCDVIVSCNIEARENYEGLASIANLLPKCVIDRLILAKAKAFEKGKEDYRELKRHWKQFLKDLKVCDIEQLPRGVEQIQSFLIQYGFPQKYPVFLREKV